MKKTLLIISGLLLLAGTAAGQFTGLYTERDIRLEVPVFVTGDIKAEGSAEITTGQDITITLTGNWENNAGEDLLQGENTVIFGSTTQSQEIGGTQKTVFNNLTADNTHSGIILAQDIDVNNHLAMSSGYFDLQNSTVDLDDTGLLIGEAESNRIMTSDAFNHTGTIRSRAVINNSTVEPGNIGVEIETSENLGDVEVIRGHQRLEGTGIFTGNHGIRRYFDVSPETNGSADLKFYYFDVELTGHNPDQLILFHWVDDGGGYYWKPKETGLHTGYVSASTEGFSLFTVASEDEPLPVELLYFKADWKNENKEIIKLEWETASETNSDHYEIHRSHDNLNSWQIINTTEAAGYSNYNIYYSMLDKNPRLDTDVLYYRLKQVDFDGTYTFSDIAEVAVPGKLHDGELKIVSIYPNPAMHEINISMFSPINAGVYVYVWDKNGRNLIFEKAEIKQGNNRVKIDVSMLAAGLYKVQVVTSGGRERGSKGFVVR